MKTYAYLLIAMCVISTLAGCTMYRSSSEPTLPPPITAFKDPEFNTAAYRRLAVLVDTADLEWRHRLETRMVEKMQARKIGSVESFRMLAPTRSWSEDQRRDTLAKNGVDAYLRLVVDGLEVDEQTRPVTTTTTVSREKKPRPGRKDSLDEETVITSSTGGDVVRTVRARYRVQLVDVKSGHFAWIALSRIEGDPMARISSFCDEIAVQLLRDSLIALPGT